MKKLERRAFICILMILCLVAGMTIFIVRLTRDGGKWATFYANQHIYANGKLGLGNIYDRNGSILEENQDGNIVFNDDYWARRGTVHVVGDRNGNIATSAEVAYRKDIVGYSLLTGTYSITGNGRDIKLTIDAEMSAAAARALGERHGTVLIYNYQTGEILTMVSGPNYDPEEKLGDVDESSGLFINRALSSKIVPGSIFKVVTSAAAIENVPDIDEFKYYCGGTYRIGNEDLRCFAPHGPVDFRRALITSCNGAFAQITNMCGASIMEDYVNKLGLTKTYDIDGIKNIPGSFEFPKNNEFNLGWAGIGQYNDLLNPLSMAVFMGAIAGDGKAAEPVLLHKPFRIPKFTDQMIEPETAARLQEMMRADVTEGYGDSKFPGLEVYAKTGTAQLQGKTPNAWMAGFLKDENYPYAFVILAENSGYGVVECPPILNAVMDVAKNKN